MRGDRTNTVNLPWYHRTPYMVMCVKGFIIEFHRMLSALGPLHGKTMHITSVISYIITCN